jgi:hypothetical protein
LPTSRISDLDTELLLANAGFAIAVDDTNIPIAATASTATIAVLVFVTFTIFTWFTLLI